MNLWSSVPAAARDAAGAAYAEGELVPRSGRGHAAEDGQAEAAAAAQQVIIILILQLT